MSARNGYEPGTPCWVDHSSHDPEAAASFYRDLLGWEAEDQMPPDAPGRYFMCRLRGRDVAAVGSQQAEDAPPMWNTYVAVEDADASAAAVREAAGTVLGQPFDIFDAGRMAVAADPAGASFCLWQAGTHAGAGLVNEPGTLCWNELSTTDADGAKAFYGSVFGWRDSLMDAEAGYTLWHSPGQGEPDAESVIGGMMPMASEDAGRPPSWGVCFAVEDSDATAARCEQLVGAIAVPPSDTPVGRFGVLSDPQGASFAVIVLAEQAP
ncbi:VOC family protein [soil metagenome]